MSYQNAVQVACYIIRKHKKLDFDESIRQLDEQNKLKQEKKRLEQIKKRRLALETVVKTLDEIQVS